MPVPRVDQYGNTGDDRAVPTIVGDARSRHQYPAHDVGSSGHQHLRKSSVISTGQGSTIMERQSRFSEADATKLAIDRCPPRRTTVAIRSPPPGLPARSDARYTIARPRVADRVAFSPSVRWLPHGARRQLPGPRGRTGYDKLYCRNLDGEDIRWRTEPRLPSGRRRRSPRKIASAAARWEGVGRRQTRLKLAVRRFIRTTKHAMPSAVRGHLVNSRPHRVDFSSETPCFMLEA